MDNFEGKVAVVTGGASGIGLAIAAELVRRGCHIVLVDIDSDQLEKVVVELRENNAKNVKIIYQTVDVCDVAQIESLHALVLQEFGKVHLLFNNAGAMGPSSMFSNKKEWDWILKSVIITSILIICRFTFAAFCFINPSSLNLNSVVHGVRLFVPTMVKQVASASRDK